jgi:hypothetical protein
MGPRGRAAGGWLCGRCCLFHNLWGGVGVFRIYGFGVSHRVCPYRLGEKKKAKKKKTPNKQNNKKIKAKKQEKPHTLRP